MDKIGNNNQHIKCPYCSCIFFNQVDLQKHLKRFGTNATEHQDYYNKTHGRVEHGYSDE